MGNSTLRAYLSIKSGLERVVSRIVPPREIEDVVQETYVRVCQVSQKQNIRSVQAFMYTTAKNIALNHVRRAEHRLADSYGDLDTHDELVGRADGTFDQVCSDEEFALFCAAVRRLPTQCRRAFVLMKVYGYSQREIAKKMQISEKTVEKHVALGMLRCVEQLESLSQIPRTDRGTGRSSAVRAHSAGTDGGGRV